MITRMLERWKERRAIRKWQRSSLGQLLASHTEEYFTKYPKLANFSSEAKTKLVGDFYQAVLSLPKAEDPFLAMRERLAGYVVGFSGYQVWCLTEEEKAGAFYSDCPYISGTLYKHIDKAVQHLDDLREIKCKNPEISSEDLVSFCNTRCVLYLYYLNGFNLVRSEFDDLDKEKDWFRPFLRSMLIWHEDQMREKIGLKSLLPDTLDGLKHWTFMNRVVEGHRNPYLEWEKSWAEGPA